MSVNENCVIDMFFRWNVYHFQVLTRWTEMISEDPKHKVRVEEVVKFCILIIVRVNGQLM